MTGGMVGADADELRRLAARCAQAAGQIETLARTLRQRLYSAGWDGQDALIFRRDWEGRHSPVLTSVAAGLRTAGQTLLAEAQQQVAASTAGIGTSATAEAGSKIKDGERSRSRKEPRGLGLPPWWEMAGWGPGILGGAATLIQRRNLHNNYSDHFRGLLRSMNRSDHWRSAAGPVSRAAPLVAFFDRTVPYAHSPVLKRISSWDRAGHIPRLADHPVASGASKIFGVASILDETAKARQSWDGGDKVGAGLHAADAVASGMKASKNPVLFLGGVAIDAWTDVIDRSRNPEEYKPWSPKDLLTLL